MESNLYETLGQVSSADAGQIFRDHLRGFVRQMISEVMAAEVNELCGPKHKPSVSDHFRAGSSSGRVLLDGAIICPRVFIRFGNMPRSDLEIHGTQYSLRFQSLESLFPDNYCPKLLLLYCPNK